MHENYMPNSYICLLHLIHNVMNETTNRMYALCCILSLNSKREEEMNEQPKKKMWKKYVLFAI